MGILGLKSVAHMMRVDMFDIGLPNHSKVLALGICQCSHYTDP